MPSRQDEHLSEILGRLDSDAYQAAWSDFLAASSPVILQVVRLFERDDDRVSDCFLFVCEQLSHNRFRRLRKFKPEGKASFFTWLRSVARNLCRDWRRQRLGRPRIFRSVSRLSTLDQEVFRRVHQQGMTLSETRYALDILFPKLTEARIAESVERIERCLSSRQRWLLSTRQVRLQPLTSPSSEEGRPIEQEIPNPGPDPETVAELRERRAALTHALSQLSKSERLLLRLRYEQELSLAEVARLAKLSNAQQADRRIRKALEALRKEMSQA